MGCCDSKIEISQKNIPLFTKNCIEKNNFRLISKFMSEAFVKDNKKTILNSLDNISIRVKLLDLNALGYALFLGHRSIFIILHKFGCSLSAMESLLNCQNLPAITLICSKGYSDILAYYLPYYLELHSNDNSQDKLCTIDFHLDLDANPNNTTHFTAIHLAVQYNHISIITIINDYFKNACQVPFELDIAYQDQLFGENCALLSCRYGSYPMVKFLHSKCGANFFIKNKNEENALQIAASGSRLNPHLQYFMIIKYLVNVIGIDIRYKYQETLQLIENKEIATFLEEKFRLSDAFAVKIEVKDGFNSSLNVRSLQIARDDAFSLETSLYK